MLKTLCLAFGTHDIEKAGLNLSMLIEQEFNINMQALGALQLEVNSLASVVFENFSILDALMAQQRGACVIIGEKNAVSGKTTKGM